MLEKKYEKLVGTFDKMDREGWCEGCNGCYADCMKSRICQAYIDYNMGQEEN